MFEILDPDDPELALRDRVAAEISAFWERPIAECSPEEIDRFFRLRRISLDAGEIDAYQAVIVRLTRAASVRFGRGDEGAFARKRTRPSGTSPGPIAAANDTRFPPATTSTIDGLDDPLAVAGNETGPPSFDTKARDERATPRSKVLKRAGARRGPLPDRDTDPIVVPTPQLTVSNLGPDVLAIEWTGFVEGRDLATTLRLALRMRRRRDLRYLVLDMRGASALTREDGEWYQRWLLTLRGPAAVALVMPVSAPARFQMSRILRDLDAGRARASDWIMPLGVARSIGDALAYFGDHPESPTRVPPNQTSDSPVVAVDDEGGASATRPRRPLGFDRR